MNLECGAVCMAYLSWDCKQDPANCIDRGISLRNRNPCSQRISCDCFKYGMSRSLVSCRTKMFILFHCSIQTFRFLESIYHDHPTRGLSTFLNELRRRPIDSNNLLQSRLFGPFTSYIDVDLRAMNGIFPQLTKKNRSELDETGETFIPIKSLAILFLKFRVKLTKGSSKLLG